MKYASQITNLAIGLERRFMGLISTGVSADTMRKFTALETLSLDVRLFLGPTPESCERRDSHIENLGGAEPVRWNPTTDTPRLIDVLPSTLRELELFVAPYMDIRWDMRHWPQLLLGFRDGRDKKLPNLAAFTLRELTPFSAVTSSNCQEIAELAGAEYKAENNVQIAWRREFQEEDLIYWGC